MIKALQILSVIGWCVPLWLFRATPIRRAATSYDQLRASVWFMSLSAMLFPLRWLVFPYAASPMALPELASWCAAYTLGIFGSAGLTMATWRLGHGR